MRILKFCFWITLISVYSITNCFSQVSMPLHILENPPDARYSGMGYTGTAVANDIYAIFWNPGGLGLLKNGQDEGTPYFEDAVSYLINPSYSKEGELLLSSVLGWYSESLNGVVAFEATNHDLGEYTRSAAGGQELGIYSSQESLIGIAYARSIAEDWGIGMKAKYFFSSLAPPAVAGENPGGADGYAFDLGVLWNPDLDVELNSILDNKSFSLGLSLLNLGPKVVYREEADPLPTTLRFGTSIRLNILSEHQITFAVEGLKYLVKRTELDTDPLPKSLISSWENMDFGFGMGLEFWFKKTVAFRAGYYTEPEVLGNRNFTTFGGSVRVWPGQIDISYNHTSAMTKYLTNVIRLTLRVGT